jgi:hypothetical protein
MVLDEVADGLRQNRREKRPDMRSMWLWRLAPTLDPRVAMALGDVLADSQLRGDGCALLGIYYIPSDEIKGETSACFDEWWKRSQAGLRRRAKQLPQ